MKDKDILLIAELISSLQVLRSLPNGLKNATTAYDDVRDRFRCRGWQSAEEIAKCIREVSP